MRFASSRGGTGEQSGKAVLIAAKNYLFESEIGEVQHG